MNEEKTNRTCDDCSNCQKDETKKSDHLLTEDNQKREAYLLLEEIIKDSKNLKV